MFLCVLIGGSFGKCLINLISNSENITQVVILPLTETEKKAIKEKVINALRQAYDPEIPVNVYDLGLVYDVRIKDDKTIEIDMTLTAPGCPIAGMVVAIVEATVQEALGDEYKVKVNLVWDPPWSPERVTPQGREALKELYGYDIVSEWLKQYKSGET